jgi:hypothetical protein
LRRIADIDKPERKIAVAKQMSRALAEVSPIDLKIGRMLSGSTEVYVTRYRCDLANDPFL